MRTFVIGDIHGCFYSLQHLLFDICKVTKRDKLIFLGDYIDRGIFIKETIDLILELIDKGFNIVALRGNHEQYLLESLNDPKRLVNWLRNGGDTTLNSFMVMNPLFLEEKYIQFFMNTVFYHCEQNYICVHAGLNFKIDKPLSDTKSMLNSRINTVDSSKIDNKTLIVGHTPQSLQNIKASLLTNLIRLDGGCIYYKKVGSLGNLIALELNSMELYYTQNREGIPIISD
ncbi:MAG TPA: metallophosphoesterase family protein [Candidatus Kapabacteria bacterium]|nr:metallophosphoesterase family protein [Candidatus Kapabacteria bacterium]